MTGAVDDITVDDAIAQWTPPRARPPARAARTFRAQLGLPTDRPIVMTGHQPTFWHAGILAKYLATDAVARKTKTAAAWCVPDQDAVDPGIVAWPNPKTAGPGRWARAEGRVLRWEGTAENAPADGIPVGRLSPGSVVDEQSGSMPPALLRVADALRAGEVPTSAAGQVWSAHTRIMHERLGLDPGAPVAFASALPNTDLFTGLIERMRTEPKACTAAYNEAVEAEPAVGMRPLASGDRPDLIELPLWKIGSQGRRASVFASDLREGLAAEHLLPRASLFTGLLRLAGCDLFVHGTGGIGYDRVTERWFTRWLGEAMGTDFPGRLAPAGVVTATLLLDLGVPDATRTDLARAVWRARAGRHQPGLLGDESAQREKNDLVKQIAGAAYGSADRAALFDRMHTLLRQARQERADAVSALDDDAHRVRAALADRAIAKDRTWPWMLHDDETLERLRKAIATKVGT